MGVQDPGGIKPSSPWESRLLSASSARNRFDESTNAPSASWPWRANPWNRDCRRFGCGQDGPDNDALQEPHVQESEITGRPMKGRVMVDPKGVQSGEQCFLP